MNGKGKVKAFFKKMLKELKNPVNIVIYVCVVAIFYSPCIIALIIRTPGLTAAATAYFLFWLGPFTPAIPIQLAITFGIRKGMDMVRRKKKVPKEDCEHEFGELIKDEADQDGGVYYCICQKCGRKQYFGWEDDGDE